MRRLLHALIAACCVLVGAENTSATGPSADTATLLERASQPQSAHAPAPKNDELADPGAVLASGNLKSAHESYAKNPALQASEWQTQLEIARRQRLQRLYSEATPTLVTLILTNTPVELKRTALFELAVIAQEEGDLARAQQIFAHYLHKWPDDPNSPEVMLRQGLIYRQLGLNNLALTKFYAVMTTSLLVRADKLNYYQRLVLQAQTEIADTYYLQGKFGESAEFFARVLKLDSALLNKPQIHYKLVRSLTALGKFEEVSIQCYGFLESNQDAVEEPEVRFHLATALKKLGRDNDALQQVFMLLREQKSHAAAHPENWAQWQQRAGNDIANQLYKEGDCLRALEVYGALSRLNGNVEWQVPVQYQIGLTYERLQQPVKALNAYAQIIQRTTECGTNASPNLRTILDMARWRQQYLGWQTNVETMTRSIKATTAQVATSQAASGQ